MALIPLQLPPGIYRNGTEFEASNRWRDASLVRWSDGTMMPVGGWVQLDNEASSPPRGIHAWRDNSGNRRYAFGTYDALIGITGASVSVITPSGYVVGRQDAEQNTGFGGGAFGLEAFGTERADPGGFEEATTWTLDNWGENLVACASTDGRLYEWDLNPTGLAAVISNAPTGCSGLLVTEERFLFAFGSGGNTRKVQWSDREDNTTWTPTSTNEAGSIELQTVGDIQQAVKARGQTIIFTTTDAHTATYQGPPFVYGFERVGSNCGAISRLAAVSVEGGAYWMGDRGFFRYGGGAVEAIPCDVQDWIAANLNEDQKSKVCAIANAQFGEIWWFWPTATENDKYVSFDYRVGSWSIGTLARTCGVDRGVFSAPIWAAPTGVTYSHETGFVHDGSTVFAETGPISLGVGDAVMSATQLIPDELTQGQVNATFKTRFHPNDTERTYGPYTCANPTSVRFTGRQVRMRVTATGNDDWRVGVMRLEAIGRGRR